MILLAGEGAFQDEVKQVLKSEGYSEETVLVDAHAQAMMPAASRDDLMRWLTNKPALELSDIETRLKEARFALHEWRARIAHLNESTGGDWFIHDYRPLWWFDFFAKEAGEVKVIPLLSDETDYHKAIGRFLEKRLPEGAMEVKLNRKPSVSEIKAFLSGDQRGRKEIPHLAQAE